MRISSNPEQIGQVLTEGTFLPSEPQRRLKAQLLARLADNPIMDLGSLSLSDVQSLTNNAQVAKWWPQAGFQDWLLDKTESRARLEYLFALSLEAAEQILLNTDPKAQSARVSMIKILAELSGKMPRQTVQANPLPELISKMDKVELQAFLEKNGVSLQLSAAKKEVIDV